MGLYTLQCVFNAHDVIILIAPLLMMYCYILLCFLSAVLFDKHLLITSVAVTNKHGNAEGYMHMI